MAGLQYRPDASTAAGTSAASAAAHEAAAPPRAAGATGAGGAAAAGLGGGAAHNPTLNGFWNRMFGGPAAGVNGDDRKNHIGSRDAGPVQEGGMVSNLMRNAPYFGDYWEALSVTHDATNQSGLANKATAITDVALPGPLMGIVDAPFRAFDHSLFLNKDK